MNRYVALLRGINVGGHKRIKMADLKQILIAKGLQNISTYIQSGNVIYHSKDTDETTAARLIHDAINEKYGYEVGVVVVSKSKFEAIVKAHPFESEKVTQTVFTLVDPVLSDTEVDILQNYSVEGEWQHVTPDCVYLYADKPYHKVKCNTNFIEKKTSVTATTRNYKTMVALLKMMES